MTRVCQPGCALCGELVRSPHHCIARYEQAHAAFVKGNVRYREALAHAADECEPEVNDPRTGIADLCEWGDYKWLVARELPTTGLDLRAVQRAIRNLGKLGYLEYRSLYELYVDLGETQRSRKRRSVTARGRTGVRDIPALTIAEQAYLRASIG